jgi:hypothetical protein
MGVQSNVGVGRVGESKIGNEVVETTVVSVPDECNLFEEIFCGICSLERNVCDGGEPKTSLR